MRQGRGVYQIGPAVFFDESGLWYIRFHFNENCDDVLPDLAYYLASIRPSTWMCRQADHRLESGQQ